MLPSVAARWTPVDSRAADVLAAVAACVGAPWDGPGDPTGVEVDVPDEVPGWEVLDATRESLLAADRDARRRLGGHHTPPALARRLAAVALDGAPTGAVVADPACGGGAFLVAAGEVLATRVGDRRRVVERQLVGADIDPLAVATTRAALALWSGGGTARGVVVADGLGGWRPPASVDVVVGNPPFRSPLAAGARRGRLGAYTDLAGRFLVAAVDLVRPGGTVLLLQPESVLAARDAAAVRAAGRLVGLWVAGEPVFAVDVRVCAPVVRRMPPGGGLVRRWHGADVRPAGTARLDLSAPTWAHLRPGAPRARARRPGTRTIGDLATATAGFRDEFYGLAAAATEGGPGAPLVTCGLIDPGRVLWGERPARLGGRRFDRPTVDPTTLQGRLAAWVAARLTPKVLVATQTRAIEAVADRDGRYVPVTPVVAIHPHDVDDLDRIVAALADPAATAWALRHYGGTALGADRVKLSAAQVLAIPVE